MQLEQDEMKLLREAMERRLKARMLTRERKLSQLARRCEALEAGEAVQFLVALGDSGLGQVLERMDRAKGPPGRGTSGPSWPGEGDLT